MQSRPNGKREGCTEMETETYNADAVGAYNILRKYHSVSGVKKELSVTGLKTPGNNKSSCIALKEQNSSGVMDAP